MRKRELASYLGISERSIDYQVLSGMPYHAVGYAKRFDRVSVLEWHQSRHEVGRADAA